jgi:hypothetical protein
VEITSIDLHWASQPDLRKLREWGWHTPYEAGNGSETANCLQLELGRLTFLVIQQTFAAPHAEVDTFTKVYAFTTEGDNQLLRGHGQAVSLAEVFEGLTAVEQMLDACRQSTAVRDAVKEWEGTGPLVAPVNPISLDDGGVWQTRDGDFIRMRDMTDQHLGSALRVMKLRLDEGERDHWSEETLEDIAAKIVMLEDEQLLRRGPGRGLLP